MTSILPFAALALVLTMVPVLVWSIVGDRARGRRRCPSCWQRMEGVDGRRCPECGRTAASEASLRRARRRWGWAIGAGALLVASVAVLRGQSPSDLVPATAALAWLSISDSVGAFHIVRKRTHDAAVLDLAAVGDDERYLMHSWLPRREGLWDWQWRWLARIAARRATTDCGDGCAYRWWAVFAHTTEMGGLGGDRAAAESAIARMVQHPSAAVRGKFVLLAIFRDDPETTVRILRATLDDPDEAVRAASGVMIPSALEAMPNVDDLWTLLWDAIEHPTCERARVAAISVGPRRLADSLRAAELRSRIAARRDDPSEAVRRVWSWSMARLLEPAEREAFLDREVDDPDPVRRYAAISAARSLGVATEAIDHAALDFMANAPANSPDAQIAESYLAVQPIERLRRHRAAILALRLDETSELRRSQTALEADSR